MLSFARAFCVWGGVGTCCAFGIRAAFWCKKCGGFYRIGERRLREGAFTSGRAKRRLVHDHCPALNCRVLVRAVFVLEMGVKKEHTRRNPVFISGIRHCAPRTLLLEHGPFSLKDYLRCEKGRSLSMTFPKVIEGGFARAVAICAAAALALGISAPVNSAMAEGAAVETD